MKIADILREELILNRQEALKPVVRWSVRRKAQVLLALAKGIVTKDDVLEAHGIDAEELASWERAVEGEGIVALRATKRSDPPAHRSAVERPI